MRSKHLALEMLISLHTSTCVSRFKGQEDRHTHTKLTSIMYLHKVSEVLDGTEFKFNRVHIEKKNFFWLLLKR